MNLEQKLYRMSRCDVKTTLVNTIIAHFYQSYQSVVLYILKLSLTQQHIIILYGKLCS